MKRATEPGAIAAAIAAVATASWLAACRNVGIETASGGKAPTPEPALDASSLGTPRASLDSTATTSLTDRVPLLEAGAQPAPVAPVPDDVWRKSAAPLVIASNEGRSFRAAREGANACLSEGRLFGTPLVHGADGRALLSVCLGRGAYVDGEDARTFGSLLAREAVAGGKTRLRLEGNSTLHMATVALSRPAKGDALASAMVVVVELLPSTPGRAPLGRCVVGRYEPIPIADEGQRCKAHGFELQVRRSGDAPVLRVTHEGAVLAVVPFARVELP